MYMYIQTDMCMYPVHEHVLYVHVSPILADEIFIVLFALHGIQLNMNKHSTQLIDDA